MRWPSVRDDAGGGEGRAGGVHLQVPGGAGPAHVGQQVGVAAHLVDVHAVFLSVRQAAPDEGLRGEGENKARSKIIRCRSHPRQFNWNGGSLLTLASLLETGLTGNWTSVAFSIVFSCRMSCCDWLWPNGWRRKRKGGTGLEEELQRYNLNFPPPNSPSFRTDTGKI